MNFKLVQVNRTKIHSRNVKKNMPPLFFPSWTETVKILVSNRLQTNGTWEYDPLYRYLK